MFALDLFARAARRAIARSQRRLATIVVLSFGCASCSSSATDDASETVTYQRDIRPLIDSHCLGCHASGGVAPLRLDDLASVTAARELVVQAVRDRHMPPWPARDECRKSIGSLALSEQERSLFDAWRRGGFQPGDEREYAPALHPAQSTLGVPTQVMAPGGVYTPPGATDSGRCFIVGTVDRDLYLRGIQMLPSEESEVHHAHVVRVDAADLPALRLLDKNTPGLGFSCETMHATSENLMTYLPGGRAVSLADGDAIYVQGKSALVTQIHYNTSSGGAAPRGDETKVLLWALPRGQLPRRVVYRAPMAAMQNSGIPAGASDFVSRAEQPIPALDSMAAVAASTRSREPHELIGISPHAHLLATRMNAQLTRSAGGDECVVDVPKWQFHWQLDYLFEKPVQYSPTDELHIECAYDNSVANQPLIGGVRNLPHDVAWGERTSDEMCLFMVWLRVPLSAFLAARASAQ